jgi:hypothetical protein
MGFYIRKSFRLGPFRFNLSKSGIGLSAGAKGARVGVDARGRSYVHFGRGGIYYRRRLDSGDGERRLVSYRWLLLLLFAAAALWFLFAP